MCYCAGQDALGVFRGFLKICSLLRQESSRFPASFPALWAFLKHFLNFVPLFHKKQGYKYGKTL